MCVVRTFSMKLYDRVKAILESYPDTRSSDKKLIWAVWWQKGLIQTEAGMTIDFSRILFMDFLNAPTPESITRARRKVQESHPELQSKKRIYEARKAKEETKGTFVYREE